MLKNFFSSMKKKNSKTKNEIPKEHVYVDIPCYEEGNRTTQENLNLKRCCISILRSSNIRIPIDIQEREKRCIYVNSTKDIVISITRYKGKLFFIICQEDPSGYRTHQYSATITKEDL